MAAPRSPRGCCRSPRRAAARYRGWCLRACASARDARRARRQAWSGRCRAPAPGCERAFAAVGLAATFHRGLQRIKGRCKPPGGGFDRARVSHCLPIARPAADPARAMKSPKRQRFGIGNLTLAPPLRQRSPTMRAKQCRGRVSARANVSLTNAYCANPWPNSRSSFATSTRLTNTSCGRRPGLSPAFWRWRRTAPSSSLRYRRRGKPDGSIALQVRRAACRADPAQEDRLPRAARSLPRAHRKIQSEAQRHRLDGQGRGAQARQGRRRRAEERQALRPAARRADEHQGELSGGGLAHDLGRAVDEGERHRRDRGLGAAHDRRGRHAVRQDQRAADARRLAELQRRLRRDAQSVGPRPHAGRLVRRLVGRAVGRPHRHRRRLATSARRSAIRRIIAACSATSRPTG